MDSTIKFKVSAPGKIILMGEHSVVYKKQGMAAAIDKRTYLNFEETKAASDQIIINMPAIGQVTIWDFKTFYNFLGQNKPLTGETGEFSIATPQLLDHDKYLSLAHEQVDTHKESLPEVQKKALAGIFYLFGGMLWSTELEVFPFNLNIETDLVIGAGTGSSASFAVCVAAAVYTYIKLKCLGKADATDSNVSCPRFKPHHIVSKSTSSFNEQELELINSWAFAFERIVHGSPSGLDNSICTFGGGMLINSPASEDGQTKLDKIKKLPSLRLLLVDTGVTRSTSDLVQRVKDLRVLCPAAVDAVLAAMDVSAGEFIQLVLKGCPDKDHVLEATVYRALEGLIDIQQGLLSTLGVSHTRLDEICMISKRRGFHSKLTGAGGGGYAFTLIPDDARPDDIHQLTNDLVYSGFHVQDLIVGAPGLQLQF